MVVMVSMCAHADSLILYRPLYTPLHRHGHALIHYKNSLGDAYAHYIDADLVPSPSQEEEDEENCISALIY
jgi:hypothetical protein